MAPTLADRGPSALRIRYAFPQSRRPSARDFIGLVACNDGFRAQSCAWPTRLSGVGPLFASTTLDLVRRSRLTTCRRQIIEKLQQDGRRSYAGIGKAVGLSEAAVRQRVQRMVDAGVMQIVAVTIRCSSASPDRR